MSSLAREHLVDVLQGFSRVGSVFAPDRVCLAFSQATPPPLQGREGFIFHWAGSSLPWFLRPLALIVSAGQYLVELTRPESVTTFALAADDEFTIKFYSFPRALLPAVLARLGEAGFDEGMALAHQDAAYAEFEFCADMDDLGRVMVLCRGNRECPSDLVRFFDEVDALE